MRLHSKIIVMTTPVVIISMVFIGVISYTYLRKSICDSAYDTAQTVLQHTETEILSIYERAENNMRLFSGSSILKHYLLTADEEERISLLQPTLIRLFSSYLKANPDYYEMRVIMPDGYEDTRVVLQDLPNHTEQEASTPFFIGMNNCETDLFSMIAINPDNNKPAFLIGKKFNLRDPRIDTINSPTTLRGYLTVTIDIDPLANYLHPPQERYGTNFLIADRQGTVLFSSLPNALEKGISPDLFSLVTDKDHIEEPVHYLNNKTESLVFSLKVHDDFIVLAIIPKSKLFADTKQLGFTITLITLGCIFIFSALLIVIGEKLIVSPIMKLRDAAAEMGEGKLEFKLKDHSNDEIGELGRSLLTMSRNLHKSQAQIRHLAYHDFLTGLPNRVMLNDFLKRAVAGAQRHNEMLALLFIDLDNFKSINDTLGHKMGDLLLKKVAGQIESAIRNSRMISQSSLNRETDQVSRIGGDEFIVVLPCLERQNDAARVARRLLESLSLPFLLEGKEVYVTVSIGISIFPVDSDIPEKLIRNADVAMYHAKESGKNTYRYYSISMNTAALERLTVESELRAALDRKEFLLQYQPQVDCSSGKIVGLEALIRWQHPEKGLILPENFIAIAEENGLILSIGEWVFRSAALQVKTWQEDGFPVVPISINLSPIQFLNSELESMIRQILYETQVPASFFKVELTETVFIKAKGKSLQSLLAIKDTGLRICLDDFGTGYSSLTHLTEFPIDELKINRSFITNLLTDPRDSEIVSAMIALAKGLGLTVVAEGVESVEQVDFLKNTQCDFIQGFHFYPPLFPEEVEETWTHIQG